MSLVQHALHLGPLDNNSYVIAVPETARGRRGRRRLRARGGDRAGARAAARRAPAAQHARPLRPRRRACARCRRRCGGEYYAASRGPPAARRALAAGRDVRLPARRSRPTRRTISPTGSASRSASETLEVIHTPGHSPGGVCFRWRRRSVGGRHAVRGLGRPHRSARRLVRAAGALDPRRGCSRSATRSACTPGTARRPRSATSGAHNPFVGREARLRVSRSRTAHWPARLRARPHRVHRARRGRGRRGRRSARAPACGSTPWCAATRDRIEVGDDSNLQDNVVVHVDEGQPGADRRARHRRPSRRSSTAA